VAPLLAGWRGSRGVGAAIEVPGLSKRYGRTVGVDGPVLSGQGTQQLAPWVGLGVFCGVRGGGSPRRVLVDPSPRRV